LLGSDQLQREWVIGELSKGLLPWSALWGPVTGKARQQLAHRSAAVNPRREPVLGLVSLARALKEAGNAGEAERVLRLSLAARPDQVVLLEALGKLLAEQKRWPEAIEFYRTARGLRPHLGVALSFALRQAGRAGEAEAILRELADKSPHNPEMYFHLGNALHAQKKPT